MTRRQYAGGAAATTIVGSIASSGSGTVTIANMTGWPDGSVGKFHVVVDAGTSAEEKILVDLRSGTTLSWSPGGRGADGTVSTSHAAGATIWLCVTALDLDEANAHVNNTATAHAASAITFAPAGNIVATTVQAAIAELDQDTDVRLDAVELVTATVNGDNWITQGDLTDGCVGTAEIIDANVTLAKLAADSVNASKIVAGAVGESELGSGVATWTPTVAQGASTNIAKTVNEARYCLIGGLLYFWVDLSMTGSGSSGSTITITLPATAVGHATAAQFGNAMYFDVSASATVRRWMGSWELASTSTVSISATDSQETGLVGAGFAVASGDVIRGSGFYRWA